MADRSSYWNEFYSHWANRFPSQFGALAAAELPDHLGVLEIGTGSGRDALHLAKRTHVLAVDASLVAIDGNRNFANSINIRSVEFHRLELTSDSRWHGKLGEMLASQSARSRWVCYARFFLHSIGEGVEDSLLSFVTNQPSVTGIMFEFRNSKDVETSKVHGEHFRRFIEHNRFRKKLLSCGMSIEMEVSGRGMAYYRGEDPFVSRFFANKK